MDSLVELLALLALHWRVGVATLIAFALAVVLSLALAWFTGWYGVVLVLFGFGSGMLWEAEPRSGKAR